uniref:Envoplakin a n=1 Tax=Callorhinchus milii TaxID=7868 RepID=A0A4W3GW75_CALMI
LLNAAQFNVFILPRSCCRTQSNEMLLLISRLQSNGDQVEHDILSTENKLQMYLAQKKPFRHQEVIKDSLSRSEELLRDMFMDADKVGRLKHPQSKEIENDVKKMHERWAKQCSEYRDMYEKLELPKDDSSVDWPRILEQKQREISAGQYGPQLPELEKQIGEHNILSRELESYGPKINSKSVSNPVSSGAEQLPAAPYIYIKQYQNLQDQAKKRKQELNTVYDYIQGCSKQLMFLNEQEEKIQKLDWSDRMMNPEEVRRQYESFKKNGLLEEEDNVNKIQENGNRLIELKHPGSPAHKEAVRNDWQQFLNLCICQEAHLKNVEDYRKVTEKWGGGRERAPLLSLATTRWAVLLNQLFRSLDITLRLGQVMPLKSRRTPVSKPMPVSALCDWGDDPKSEINRGEKLVLRNNNDNDNWVVATNNGQTKKAPGVCFSIPPPDPEALAQVNRSVRAVISFSTRSSHRYELTVLFSRTNAQLKLESDIKKVDDVLKPYELNLAEEMVVPASPNAIQDRQAELQRLKQNLDNDQDSVQTLNQSLKKTDQSCKALQLNFQEFCPDFKSQQADVQHLNTRYNNIRDQLERREAMIENADSKYNNLKSSEQNLNSFMKSLPVNQLNPMDSLRDTENKLRSQEVGTCPGCRNSKPEEQSESSYFCSSLKQEDSPISQTVQNNKALFATRNMNDLKEEMIKEAEKIRLAEADLKEQKEELQMLKIQRPVDMKQEKEVVDFYRDPKTETDLNTLRNKIHEERKKRQNTEMDKNGLVKKLRNLEDKQNSIVPNLLIKEVTRLEKDPLLDVEAENLRNDINMCNRETQLTEGELDHLKRQISNLEKTPVNVVEKVVVVEKVKVEKDPEMLRASRNLQNQIDEEDQKRQTITNNIRSVADEIDSLEHKIRKITPKVIIKEIQKIEKDPELQKESSKLRKWCEDERQNNALLSSDLNDLQKAYNIVNEKKLKVEVKEIVRENFRVAPETEKEIVDLKKEIQELLKRKSQLEIELTLLKGDLNVLKDQQPHIEYKEIVNEVEKLQKTPEMLNQIDHLNNELNKLSDTSKRIKENINDLKDERDDWRKRRNKVETKVVTKDVVKYLNDPILEKEAESLRKEVRDESQKRRDLESLVFDLQQKYLLIERQKPKEKTVVQETVRLQKDPKIIREHDNLGKNLDDERRLRRNLDREVQNLKALLKEKEAEINLEEERSKKLQSLHELNRIKDRIYELETAPPPVEERIVTEEVLKIEKDPLIEKACLSYRRELEDEKNKIVDLEQEKKRVEFEVDLLHREKSQEKTIYKEVVRVTKDKALEEERSRARDQYNKEKNSRLDVLEEIRRLKERLQKLDDMKRTHSREEAELKKMRDANLHEKDALEDELKDLENEKEQKTSQQLNESKLMSRQHEKEKEKRNQLGNEVTALERDIIKENDKLHDREYTVRDLQSQINREEARHRDTQLRETNLSTKITILDSETGKDLSPYEAYKRNLIDREQYIQLQELECDWEEISTLGPSGVTSVLRDKKSGKHYSIEDALKNRKITKEELYLYREGKIPISEFALLVAGEDKPKTLQRPALKQTDYTPHIERDKFPIAGVYDTMTNSKLSINSGLNRKLIDPLTAQKILEAQAATGGIIDVGTRERFSVSQAVDKGLIDRGHMQRLLNAQKAFTGVEDPMTGERLPVGLALKNGWLPAETALRYLEAQHLTGGLVDPNKSGRVSIRDALQNGMIDSNTARMLQEESNYVKDLIDPMTNERIHYREMMERCQKDELSGLLLIPAASSEQSSYQPNSRFDYKPRYTSGY